MDQLVFWILLFLLWIVFPIDGRLNFRNEKKKLCTVEPGGKHPTQ